MWTESDQKAWANLLERYQNNVPAEIMTEDLALIKKLYREYVETGDMRYFNQYKHFLNLHLLAWLKGKDITHVETFMTYCEQGLMTKFTFFNLFYPWHSEASDEFRNAALVAFANFWKIIEPIHEKHNNAVGIAKLPPRLYDQLYPDYGFSSVIANPNGKPEQDLGDHAYETMLNKICTVAKQFEPDLKIEAEKSALVSAKQKHERSRVFRSITHFFDDFGLQSLAHVFPYFYVRQTVGGECLLHPNTAIGIDIILTPEQQIFTKLFFKQERSQERNEGCSMHAAKSIIAVTLLGMLMVKTTPAFAGYQILPKMSGKDPGFILVSPDKKQRMFVKFTKEVYEEYFVAKLLLYFGIKMAECSLYVDEFGNPFLLTKDLSRAYVKGSKPKAKSFSPLALLRNMDTPLAFFHTKASPLTIEQQKEALEGFLASTFKQKNARISYAKLLLMSEALGLSDFGGHGGNIGPIFTTAGSKVYIKFGIVDYSLSPELIAKNPKIVLLEKIRETVSGMQPIFQRMFEQLSEQDFIDAYMVLRSPKTRAHSAEGHCLATAPATLSTPGILAVMEKVHQEFLKEFRAIGQKKLDITEKALLKATFQKIQTHKEIIKTNLTFIANTFGKHAEEVTTVLESIKQTLAEGEKFAPETTELILGYYNAKQTKMRICVEENAPTATVQSAQTASTSLNK